MAAKKKAVKRKKPLITNRNVRKQLEALDMPMEAVKPRPKRKKK